MLLLISSWQQLYYITPQTTAVLRLKLLLFFISHRRTAFCFYPSLQIEAIFNSTSDNGCFVRFLPEKNCFYCFPETCRNFCMLNFYFLQEITDCHFSTDNSFSNLSLGKDSFLFLNRRRLLVFFPEKTAVFIFYFHYVCFFPPKQRFCFIKPQITAVFNFFTTDKDCFLFLRR